MRKKIVQDVVPPKRSIRQIQLPDETEAHDRIEEPPLMQPEPERPPKRAKAVVRKMDEVYRPEPRERYGGSAPASRVLDDLDISEPTVRPQDGPAEPVVREGVRTLGARRKIIGSAVAVVVLAAAAFVGVNMLFGGAEVVILPRREQVTIDGTFDAYKVPLGPLDLPYEIMAVSKELGTDVPSTGKELVEEYASGMITIYNGYDESDMRFVGNTRFESADGKIFRIRSAIVIPGARRVGEDLQPGQVQAEVFADEPGESYNIDATRFTIPGLAGDPRFEAVYAQSDVAMRGGFSGERGVVDEATAEAARDELRVKLRAELMNQARLEKPTGYEVFESAIREVYENMPTQTGDERVTVVEKLTLEVVMFKNEHLARFIAQNAVEEYDNGDVVMPATDALTVELLQSDMGEGESIANRESVDLVIRGGGEIVWLFDEERLRNDLAGTQKSESAFNTILAGYPGVANGRAYIRPFWQSTFPEDPSRITVVIEKP